MKFIAKNTLISMYPTGGISLTFDCSISAKEKLQELKQGDYVVTIEKLTNKRSLNQNSLLWKLIGEINEEINGVRSTAEDENIYCQVLQMASVKCDYFQCLPETVQRLKELYRVVEVYERSSQSVFCKCYIGISQMDTIQASAVIDQALRYADEVGINTDYYRKELND